MKARITWQGKRKFEAVADSGHPVTLDSSLDSGGEDAGPRPMEVVLMALGGCTGMDVVSILERMRIPFTGARVDIEAERASEHPKVFTGLDMTYHIWGENLAASEEKVARAVQLTQEKYCSVLHMVNKTARVNYRYVLHAPGEQA
ncbi:MAG: OsmC family protein [Firmicutes bacterium]|nr:OsmC family protein [Bacillota bacterium]